MTDSSNITINGANSTVTDNSRFEYRLKGSMTLNDMEIALAKGTVFHSFLNVSSSVYKNTTLQYTWPNGAGMDTYTVTMPDGMYDIDNGIDGFIRNQMLLNKTYLVDNTGDPVYYMNIRANIIYYRCTLTSTPVPTVLPSGYSMPVGATWTLPTVAKTPQLIISGDNANTGKLIGFDVGSYPNVVQPSVYQVNGSLVPQINPQYEFNVCVSLVNLPYLNTIPNMIYNFTFTRPPGSQEPLVPYEKQFYSVTNGSYSEIIVTVVDQKGKPVLLRDPSSSFTLQLRKKRK